MHKNAILHITLGILLVIIVSPIPLTFAQITSFDVYYTKPYRSSDIKVTLKSLETGAATSTVVFNANNYDYAALQLETGPHRHNVEVCIENYSLRSQGATFDESTNCKRYTTTNWAHSVNIDTPCSFEKSPGNWYSNCPISEIPNDQPQGHDFTPKLPPEWGIKIPPPNEWTFP